VADKLTFLEYVCDLTSGLHFCGFILFLLQVLSNLYTKCYAPACNWIKKGAEFGNFTKGYCKIQSGGKKYPKEEGLKTVEIFIIS